MVATLDMGFLVRESEDVYRARAKDNLTSHALADFRSDPYLFHKKRLGLVPDEDRPAYLLGRAAHTLILEGRDRYEAEYAFGGPVNPKTGAPSSRTTRRPSSRTSTPRSAGTPSPQNFSRRALPRASSASSTAASPANRASTG